MWKVDGGTAIVVVCAYCVAFALQVNEIYFGENATMLLTTRSSYKTPLLSIWAARNVPAAKVVNIIIWFNESAEIFYGSIILSMQYSDTIIHTKMHTYTYKCTYMTQCLYT